MTTSPTTIDDADPEIREHDTDRTSPTAPAFITATARTAMDLGYHLVLEGILHTARYSDALRRRIGEHPGPCHVYYLDVAFDETVRRHHRRAEPIDVTAEQMRGWYTAQDLLGVDGEHVIEQASTFEQTVATILETSGLTDTAPLTPCPLRCPHCATDPVEGDTAAPARPC